MVGDFLVMDGVFMNALFVLALFSGGRAAVRASNADYTEPSDGGNRGPAVRLSAFMLCVALYAWLGWWSLLVMVLPVGVLLALAALSALPGVAYSWWAYDRSLGWYMKRWKQYFRCYKHATTGEYIEHVRAYTDDVIAQLAGGMPQFSGIARYWKREVWLFKKGRDNMRRCPCVQCAFLRGDDSAAVVVVEVSPGGECYKVTQNAMLRLRALRKRAHGMVLTEREEAICSKLTAEARVAPDKWCYTEVAIRLATTGVLATPDEVNDPRNLLVSYTDLREVCKDTNCNRNHREATGATLVTATAQGGEGNGTTVG